MSILAIDADLRLVLSSAAVISVLVGCGSAQPTAAPQVSRASGAEQTATAPDLGWHMQATFWDAVRVRDALIDGELADAQRAAERIAQTDYGTVLPADWKAGVGAMQQHAAALSIAPNLAAAAQELSRIALACGDCHEVRARGPEPLPTAPLPWEDPPESLGERMHRHEDGYRPDVGWTRHAIGKRMAQRHRDHHARTATSALLAHVVERDGLRCEPALARAPFQIEEGWPNLRFGAGAEP